MPVIFCLIGYLLLIIALRPVWSYASNVIAMVSADEAPHFSSELSSIYDPSGLMDHPIEIHTEVIEVEVPVETVETDALFDPDALEMNPVEIHTEVLEEEVTDDGIDTDAAEDAGLEAIADGEMSAIDHVKPQIVANHFVTVSQAAELSDSTEPSGNTDLAGTAEAVNGADAAAAGQTTDPAAAVQTGDTATDQAAAAATKTTTVIHEYIDFSELPFPKSGNQYGQIICDRIGLDCPVYWYDTEEILRYGAGQYIGSLLPGFNSLIVLSGHNLTHFAPLQYIQEEDVIEFKTYYGNYEYEVTEIKVFDENDLETYIAEHVFDEEETLLMYTCYPFEAIVGRKTDRLTVFAKRISGYDVKWKEDVPETTASEEAADE